MSFKIKLCSCGSWLGNKWSVQAVHFNMDAFEGRLVELVHLYKLLYDPCSRPQGQPNDFASRVAISLHEFKDDTFCWKVWKNMRDCFMKAKKRTHAKSGDPGGKWSCRFRWSWDGCLRSNIERWTIISTCFGLSFFFVCSCLVCTHQSS